MLLQFFSIVTVAQPFSKYFTYKQVQYFFPTRNKTVLVAYRANITLQQSERNLNIPFKRSVLF